MCSKNTDGKCKAMKDDETLAFLFVMESCFIFVLKWKETNHKLLAIAGIFMYLQKIKSIEY